MPKGRFDVGEKFVFAPITSISSRKELYVFEPLTPKLSDAEMRNVEQRIRRIHDRIVKRHG